MAQSKVPGNIGPVIPKCENMQILADEMLCQSSHCNFHGSVKMSCPDAWARVNTLDVFFNKDREITKLQIDGPITVISGPSITTCKYINVDTDGFIKNLVGARIRIKSSPAADTLLALKEQAIISGINQAEVTGEMKQLDDDTYRIDDGTITLCDCGERPPSWWAYTPKATLQLNKRVHLYSPVFHITPIENLSVPVFWFPYISYPLKDRAVGFLAPIIESSFGAWPAVELPFFVPLGRSWDITLRPGYFPGRGPKAGFELRYAPLQGTTGRILFLYSNDYQHGAAQSFQFDTSEDEDKIPDTADPMRERLEHRGMLEVEHRSSFFQDNLQIKLNGRLASDDKYYYDYANVYAALRRNHYQATRFNLLGRLGPVSLSVSADFYQDLYPSGENFERFSPEQCLEDSNTDACNLYYTKQRMRESISRLPEIKMIVTPIQLGELPVHVSAELGTNWHSAFDGGSLGGFKQTALGVLYGHTQVEANFLEYNIPLTAGVGYGYVRSIAGETMQAYTHFPQLYAHSQITIGRDYLNNSNAHNNDGLRHLVTFHADYLLVPQVYTDGMVNLLWDQVALSDSRLQDQDWASKFIRAPMLIAEQMQISPVHQLQLGFHSSLTFLPGDFQTVFDVSQGFNLGGLDEETYQGLGSVYPAGIGQLQMLLSTNFGVYRSSIKAVWGVRKEERGLKWLVASNTLTLWRGTRLYVTYQELKGGSENVQTGYYELFPGGGLPDVLGQGQERQISFGINFNYKNIWTGRFSAARRLPLDYWEADSVRQRDAIIEDNLLHRSNFSGYGISLGYQSPCHCWGVSVMISLPHQYLFPNENDPYVYYPTYSINIDLAGLALGATRTN